MGKKDEDKSTGDVPILCAIAKPLANEKLAGKVLKVIKKATKRKQVKRGVKEVVKAIRKKTSGFCILAGNISPIDVLSHLPVLCEDNNIPYIFVPSKEELGAASCSKRPTSCMLVLSKPLKPVKDDDEDKFKELYDGIVDKIKGQQVIY
mmetsp:Transcript_35877/g.49790  ORF Transcript_35877/g.49790 Transcript_35877/m.49790 type:complete len:149 (+) Transcript_35877:123-569(+)|eukprot:CAMPEP_0196582262 /NCGR_PEP_ID=MMETSP1081-20130531/38318_1 /TAXON_ID=36882 /ORGANISM="Pyramimonas amylifera, Strain CCMP720" /LENGTH=148 /DNA_ID=CAMNT_0041902773 /DNA_START=121 /DNA_END=567 /DNA_ORIENTATION=+